MLFVARIIASVMAFLAVYLFFFWAVYAQIFDEPFVSTVAALLTAMAAAVWVWRSMGAAGRSVLTTATYWAVLAGALGFCGGFFGPLIVAPDANQGPLLGIFITGPLGFIAGGIGGLIYALWHRAKTASGV